MSEIIALSSRQKRLSLYRSWANDTFYDSVLNDVVAEDLVPRQRLQTAKIITRRHIGLEIPSPPGLTVEDERAAKWLERIFKANSFRAAMPAAARIKSWAGDIGVQFVYRASERKLLGTPWQVRFIDPDLYEVLEWRSGVITRMAVIWAERVADPLDLKQQAQVTRWHCEEWTHDEVRRFAPIASEARIGYLAFAQQLYSDVGPDGQPLNVVWKSNTLGLIPFVIVKNISSDPNAWEGMSDYDQLTYAMHRINVQVDQIEQGQQLANKLRMILIDAEEFTVREDGGVLVADVKSDQSGATEHQAKIEGAPMDVNGVAGAAFDLLRLTLDTTLEAAGVMQLGSTKEVFGNEPASTSALRAFYGPQAAVAIEKRANWEGEGTDFGLKALVRKLLTASMRQEGDSSPVSSLSAEEIDDPRYELQFAWPALFQLSPAEQQTLAAVVQQAADDGLPPEILARFWGDVLGITDRKRIKAIEAGLKKRQAENAMLTTVTRTAAQGILGSGQGDGLAPDGGSTTKMDNKDVTK